MNDTLVISNENNIIHICNQGYTVDYTIYNSKGHNMDGGILESSKGKFDTNVVTQEIINIIKDTFAFSSPYIYLSGDKAENLLELIEMEDYKSLQQQIKNKELSTEEKSNEINIEK